MLDNSNNGCRNENMQKPEKQTKPPTTHGNKKRSTMLHEAETYQVNQAKWTAARQWCDKNGYG